jgi:hypothetical protein
MLSAAVATIHVRWTLPGRSGWCSWPDGVASSLFASRSRAAVVSSGPARPAGRCLRFTGRFGLQPRRLLPGTQFGCGQGQPIRRHHAVRRPSRPEATYRDLTRHGAKAKP